MEDKSHQQLCLDPYELPEDIRLMIRATPLPITSRGRDKLVWNGTSQGVFDLKSAYRMSMVSEDSQPYSAPWVWKVDTLPRIKYFLWMCGHNSIGVKSNLVKRGMLNDDCCPICHEDSETILHVLRDCPQTKSVWSQLGVQVADPRFWGYGLQDWLKWNGSKSGKSNIANLPWCTFFSFAVWSIWKRRNSFVFRNNSVNQNLPREIVNQAVEFTHCASSPRLLKQRVVQRIRWEKPPEGWMKLNTDGSAIGNPGPASCGGVIRDNTGHWIVGFNRSIGVATSFTAELWDLRDGLNMACSLNISSLIVELDAKGIVDALVNPGYVNHAISPILDDCRLLITCIPQIQFKHCFRQANRCADALARMSSSLEVDFSFFNSPSVDILCVFKDDCVGVPCSRLCYTPVGPS